MRTNIVIDDVLKFLGKVDNEKKFDTIIYDLTDFPEDIVNSDEMVFLREIIKKISTTLKPGGIISMQCGSALVKDRKLAVKKELENDYENIEFSEASIPSFFEPWLFVHATKKL